MSALDKIKSLLSPVLAPFIITAAIGEFASGQPTPPSPTTPSMIKRTVGKHAAIALGSPSEEGLRAEDGKLIFPGHTAEIHFKKGDDGKTQVAYFTRGGLEIETLPLNGKILHGIEVKGAKKDVRVYGFEHVASGPDGTDLGRFVAPLFTEHSSGEVILPEGGLCAFAPSKKRTNREELQNYLHYLGNFTVHLEKGDIKEGTPDYLIISTRRDHEPGAPGVTIRCKGTGKLEKATRNPDTVGYLDLGSYQTFRMVHTRIGPQIEVQNHRNIVKIPNPTDLADKQKGPELLIRFQEALNHALKMNAKQLIMETMQRLAPTTPNPGSQSPGKSGRMYPSPDDINEPYKTRWREEITRNENNNPGRGRVL